MAAAAVDALLTSTMSLVGSPPPPNTHARTPTHNTPPTHPHTPTDRARCPAPCPLQHSAHLVPCLVCGRSRGAPAAAPAAAGSRTGSVLGWIRPAVDQQYRPARGAAELSRAWLPLGTAASVRRRARGAPAAGDLQCASTKEVVQTPSCRLPSVARALTSYGLSCSQIAELAGVPLVSEPIEASYQQRVMALCWDRGSDGHFTAPPVFTALKTWAFG